VNILVCGFMGSGKTTFVESFRGNNIGYDCVDLDTAVATNLGILPGELGGWINTHGLESFRHREVFILSNLLKYKMMKIIALGGGTVEAEGFFDLLDQAKMVFLNVSFEACYERIKNDLNRPLTAMGEDGLRKLYNKRSPLYQKSDLSLAGNQIKGIEGLESLVHNLNSI
jgi:shikimate kinase